MNHFSMPTCSPRWLAALSMSVLVVLAGPASAEDPQVGELARKIAALESRLVVQEDINAIHKLKARYVSLADQKYLNGRPNTPEMIEKSAREFSELFLEDARWGGGSAGEMLQGRQAIYERIRGVHAPFFMHYMLSPEIRVDGDIAYARWYVLNFVQDKEGVPHILSGMEDDIYKKIDGKWYFQEMKWNDIFLAPQATGWVYPDSFPKEGSGTDPWKDMPFR